MRLCCLTTNENEEADNAVVDVKVLTRTESAKAGLRSTHSTIYTRGPGNVDPAILAARRNLIESS